MLEFSGERFIPGAGGARLHHEHVHRYRFAATLAAGRRVLDLGSGEGYGSALLASRAAAVTAIDVDAEAVEHATQRYADRGIEFRVASATDIPLADDTFDLVTCFEVIEHVDDPGALLSEVARVLAPGGVLVCSTPDRDAYNRLLSEPNPFHVSELSRAEFSALLDRRFQSVRLYAQRSATASWIDSDETSSAPEPLVPGGAPSGAVFWVAVAAVGGADAPAPPGSLLIDPERQDDQEHSELRDQLVRAQRQLDEYERNIQAMAAALRAADARAAGASRA